MSAYYLHPPDARAIFFLMKYYVMARANVLCNWGSIAYWGGAETKLIPIPVPNSNYESVLGTSNYSLLSVVIHVKFFFTCQKCVHTDFTVVRLGPIAKMKSGTWIEPTISNSLNVCSPYWATMRVAILSFAPLLYD